MERQSTRQVRFGVAMSLDGYIAGENGEADWIVMDEGIDFAGYMSQFDTLLVGRKTYAGMQAMGSPEGDESDNTGFMPSTKTYIVSRTMRPEDHPDLEIVADAVPFVTELKRRPGKNIWLFGGGELFHCLLAAGLVDGLDVGVMPVLLGGGIPFLPSPASRAKLRLRKHTVHEKTGIVGLDYDVL